MKSVKLNNMYELYENGRLVKISNGKEISKTLHKNKNYITFNFQIKINNKKYTLKLHKLMMTHFGLSKQDCIDKGFIYEYSDELYESLRKGDEAKNRKLTDIERYSDWCYRYINNYNINHNPSMTWKKLEHVMSEDKQPLYPLFKPYVPTVNRENEMTKKLIRNKQLRDFYFNVFLIEIFDGNELYMNKENFIKEYCEYCYYDRIDIEEEYKDDYDRYVKNKERSKKETKDNFIREQERRNTFIPIEVDKQFERCDDCIRICSSYVSTIQELVEMGIKNEFIFEEDIDYLLNNEVLQARMKQYNIISSTRGERVYTTEDNKNYSDYVERYMNSHTEQYLQQ